MHATGTRRMLATRDGRAVWRPVLAAGADDLGQGTVEPTTRPATTTNKPLDKTRWSVDIGQLVERFVVDQTARLCKRQDRRQLFVQSRCLSYPCYVVRHFLVQSCIFSGPSDLYLADVNFTARQQTPLQLIATRAAAAIKTTVIGRNRLAPDSATGRMT